MCIYMIQKLRVRSLPTPLSSYRRPRWQSNLPNNLFITMKNRARDSGKLSSKIYVYIYIYIYVYSGMNCKSKCTKLGWNLQAAERNFEGLRSRTGILGRAIVGAGRARNTGRSLEGLRSRTGILGELNFGAGRAWKGLAFSTVGCGLGTLVDGCRAFTGILGWDLTGADLALKVGGATGQ
jgi:hypothetical protein